MEKYLRQAIEARTENFKKEGFIFSEEDGKNGESIEVFGLAFTRFINDASQDEMQELIAQIKNSNDTFQLFQNNKSGSLYYYVLTFVTDNDRKTRVMQSFFNVGINPLFKARNGKLFLYSDHLYNSGILDTNEDVSVICLPYLKAILCSKNHDKFTEAVEEIHLGQLAFTRSNIEWPIRPDFISIGIETASKFLHDYPVVGRDVLKLFYDNLTDRRSILGNFCSNVQRLARENNEKLQRLNLIISAGVEDFCDMDRLNTREKNVIEYENLQERIVIFKEEFQKVHP